MIALSILIMLLIKVVKFWSTVYKELAGVSR